MTSDAANWALLLDHYELTMLQSAIADGAADRPAVFEVFTRKLPEGHAFGVFVGIGRVLKALPAWRFDGPATTYLASVVDEPTRRWLASWRFAGDIDAMAEGEIHVPDTPLAVVRTTFGSALLLETALLGALNHDGAVAAVGVRMVGAARGRPLIEMGSRRTHEQAAVAAARAAWIAGFASSSNLEAGRRHGVPTAGTAAHAWTMVHTGPDGERDAFRAQVGSLGIDTTLLVDTYDISAGIDIAVDVAREFGHAGPGAVRIDSGDLRQESLRARDQLDRLGARDTRIVVSGDLDEYAIDGLADVPVDGFGVGTRLVSGLVPPNAVYKIVAADDERGVPHDVAKSSPGKEMRAGAKAAWRELDADGIVVADHVTRLAPGDPPEGTAPTVADGHTVRPLLAPAVRAGEVVAETSADAARERLQRSLTEVGRWSATRAAGPRFTRR